MEWRWTENSCLTTCDFKKVEQVAGVRIFLTDDGCLIKADGSVIECCADDTIIDICSFQNSLIAITIYGSARRIDPIQDIILETLSSFRNGSDIKSPVPCCPQQFQQCAGGSQHLVLIDSDGHAWTAGSGPQTGIVHQDSHHSYSRKIVLTRLDFLQGMKIHSLAAGEDFTVVITEHCESMSPNDDEFNLSRVSCPLGLPLSDSLSNKVLHEEDIDEKELEGVELRKKTNGSLATPSEDDTSTSTASSEPHVERLAQSGMYINPSDAIQYLSNQLSWISGRQSSIDETQQTEDEEEPQTPTVKENVNKYVADGVKAVSDTVSKLSKTFSFERTAPPMDNEAKEMKLKDINPPSVMERSTTNSLCRTMSKGTPMRPSTLGHRRSQSASMLDKIIKKDIELPKQPTQTLALNQNKHFQTEVWSWGRGNRGQPGQGDMLDRLQPGIVLAPGLSGVMKIVCGAKHAVALTLTGMVFGWGDNSKGQAAPNFNLAVCSTPHQVLLPTGETAKDIAAEGNATFIVTDAGVLYTLGLEEGRSTSLKKEIKLFEDNKQLAENLIPVRIQCKDKSLFLIMQEMSLPTCNFKSLEKLFLRKVRGISNKVLKPFCKKSKDTDPSITKAKEAILTAMMNLSNLVSNSVFSSWDSTSFEDSNQMNILDRFDMFTNIFYSYVKAVLDCHVIDCLFLDSECAYLSPVICETLHSVCYQNPNELGQEILQVLLMDCFAQPQQYIACLKSIMTLGRKSKDVHVLRYCDAIEKCLLTLRTLQKKVDREKQLAEVTRCFWESSSGKFSNLKLPSRRMMLDSRQHPVHVANSGSFSKNWIILMNDVLVHAGYSSIVVHPLQVIWMDNVNDNASRFEIGLLMPEDSIILVAPSAEIKNEWLVQLNKSILEVLGAEKEAVKHISTSPPITRNTTYTFRKLPGLKGATYTGTWMQGKMHGHGTLVSPDGKTYNGQFRQNQKHGLGQLEVVDKTGVTVFDGQWKLDKFDGTGRISYPNGDVYEGMFKDGKPHGQGTHKQGKFMGSGASVYIGEWSHGIKNGYGVLDNIVAGEKYMGMWSNDMKSGPGCVVTVDGVYYEGTFSHNKMTGKGVMLFEDDTCYEGCFADAGVFSGHGFLTYANGDKLEGSFYGNYADGMKFNGTIYKTVKSPSHFEGDVPDFGSSRIGKYSVQPYMKWTAIFSQYNEQLGLPDSRDAIVKSSAAWEQLAISINQTKNSSKFKNSQQPANLDVLDGLEMIPDYCVTELTFAYYQEVKSYLTKAFSSGYHPLSRLLDTICICFNSTYGGCNNPRLLKHATDELASIVDRLYFIVKALFPALPVQGQQRWLPDVEAADGGTGEMVTPSTVVYPFVLPKVHFSLFMLYALFYKKDDEEYWSRILKWNKHPDIALLSFLGVDQKFWRLDVEPENRKSLSQIRDRHFVSAIETLQQLKTTFTPTEKLAVILQTFREVNKIGQEVCGAKHCWSMDDLFPVFQYIVVRARILQLGAEIHMIEDLMESYLHNGEFGIMFTTLQASYYQIRRETLSI